MCCFKNVDYLACLFHGIAACLLLQMMSGLDADRSACLDMCPEISILSHSHVSLSDYVPIGPRFSNLVLQALLVLLKKAPPQVNQ